MRITLSSEAIRTLGGGKALTDYIASIPRIFDSEGEMVYDSRNRIKVFNAPNGVLLNVKRYHVPTHLNRLIYSWGIRKPKGKRAFEYAAMLLAAGIDTPAGLAYFEERNAWGLLGYSYLVTPHLTGRRMLYEMVETGEHDYTGIAAGLADFTARMHEAGFLHLDYSPGNILWSPTVEGYSFSVIDINRMRIGSVSMHDGLRNLRRLWGPKHFFTAIVHRYAVLRGFDPAISEQFALAQRARFWKRYGRRHDISFQLDL